MFAEFFIRRPVFASVCAMLIVLAGAAVIPTLPIAQFPNLVPAIGMPVNDIWAALLGRIHSQHCVNTQDSWSTECFGDREVQAVETYKRELGAGCPNTLTSVSIITPP